MSTRRAPAITASPALCGTTFRPRHTGETHWARGAGGAFFASAKGDVPPTRFDSFVTCPLFNVRADFKK
jgi:hypothetical protein